LASKKASKEGLLLKLVALQERGLQQGGSFCLPFEYQVHKVVTKRILGHIEVETKKVY
jgi:hypothetical protein